MNRKRIFVLCAVGAAGAFVACSQGNVTPTPGNSAGATGTTAGATGVSGSAGSPAMSGAGAPATGGDVGASGGSTTTGGDSGSLAGASGSGTAGSTDSAGSTSGGATGSAGAPTAGSAGMSSAGGGGLSPEAIVPGLDGFLWVGDCDASGANHGKDCPIGMVGGQCPTSTNWYATGAFRTHKLAVAGTPGAKYMLNFEARGVTGGKNYNNGTAQSRATTFNQTANDGWYVGGVPTQSFWNTYEIHVTPAVPGQPVNPKANLPVCPQCPTTDDNVYYTNAILGGDGTHETFPVKFNASFPVLGGGTITLIIHDANCDGQQNCGADITASAACVQTARMIGPRTIDLSGMMPQPTPKPPISAAQPYAQTGAQVWYPQWLLFDVKSVTQL